MAEPAKPRRSRPSGSAAAPAPESPLHRAALDGFVAEDPASSKLLQLIHKVAVADSTVLIQGESGVGKDVVASLIHYLGPRPEQPLVKIDCASLPHELLESELFGYERGAFTGATQMKRGRMELAGTGTLVLDEIASLSLAVQAKLLRVIQERTFDRLGGTKPVKLYARIVAISNVDLQDAVAAGALREDLFYRLNVVPINVPALRDRPADIKPLAQKLLAQLSATYRREGLRLAPDAMAALKNYSFPGNVRELRNLLERAVVHAMGTEITPSDLPATVRDRTSPSKKLSLEELERNYIAEILDHTRGRKSKAAEILGISRKTLLEKRKKYEL
ncbi:MAG TPA: sigma-54 dependent transcriptional regulator [Terriglobales bacterium]|nr:sigma-54 dependent transcriptional regulator [Terriglobales bacterium]